MIITVIHTLLLSSALFCFLLLARNVRHSLKEFQKDSPVSDLG